MDFLSIRKKARERAEAKEGTPPEPKAEAAPAKAPEPRPAAPPEEPAREERAALPPEPPRRRRGDEPVLTEADLAEGALQARFQGLAPAGDARFATWRPGQGPPPVEPDAGGYEPSPAAAEEGPPPEAPEPEPPPRAAPAAAPLPEDPLDVFFYRPDEGAAAVPLLGSAIAEESAPAPPTAIEEFLTFLLDKEEFAIPIDRVREVLRAPAITEVPRAPAHVMGVVTVRGEVVPVIDAHSRLGLGPSSGAQARIVIVDAGEGPLGLVVDSVSSVVRLPSGGVEPCPQGIAASECVTGIGRFRDRLFMVVDVASLLGRARAAGER